MKERFDFEAQREKMVQDQIARRGIQDQRVLDALRAIPRHEFLPLEQRNWAYSDGAQRIGMGQTISQPFIVALMTEALQLKGDEKVLEIGTGSGYQAAVLGYLAKEVHTIERLPTLAAQAKQILAEQGLTNIQVHIGDGSLGLPEHVPYQGIMVTAAAPSVPQSLLQQLDEGGRLVLPVGQRFTQILQIWQRCGAKFTHDTITAVAFVPLIGDEGWDEESWEQYDF